MDSSNQDLSVEMTQRKRVMTQHLLNKAQEEIVDTKPAGSTLEVPGAGAAAVAAENKRVSFMTPQVGLKMNQLELALAPIAINCLPIQLSSNPLETLLAYIEQIKTNPQHPELIAIKYLKLFSKSKEYTIKTRDVKKLVPNMNLKIERILLKNFGITEMNAIEITNQNEKLYNLKPYQYILAVMVNSASFDDFDKRIAFAFKMYDDNNDGQIDKKDLKAMLVTYAKEDQLRVGDAAIDELADSILEDMSNGKDHATVDDFKIFLNQYSRKDVKIGVFDKQNARISYVNPSLAALAVKKKKSSKFGKAWKRLKIKLFLNYIKYMWVTIWLGLSIFLFLRFFIPSYKKLKGTDIGWSGGLARGCAGCINFNSAILLLLASKSFNTILRFLKLTFLMPLDLAVSFHKTVGKFLFFWSSLHSVCHIFFNLPFIAGLPLEIVNAVFITKIDETHSTAWWLFMSLPGSTGLGAWFFMTVLIICTIRKIRRPAYEAFWYSHKLWIPIVALTAWHGTGKFLAPPEFAYWLVFPSAVILFDMLVTVILLLRRPRRIRNLAFLESGVIELKLTKPDNYHFTCGQYCLINIPRISKWQWHPFSISSSKRDPYMTFHISPAGDWTNSLKKLAQELKNQSSSIMPAVYVQGPYGAPSQVYDNYKHIICITTGVGATPFASILRNLNQKAHETGKDIKSASVDFYWVNRRPSSHTWLNGLLQDLQNDEKSKSIVNVNIFLTSLHAKYDLRSLLLYRGISILNSKGKTVKGLDHFNVIHWGRPNWGQIFQKKSTDYPKGTKVGVFFCGNKDMGAKLFECTQKYSGNVVYDFHREVF